MGELFQLGCRTQGIAKSIRAGQFYAADYQLLNLLFKISLKTRDKYSKEIKKIKELAECRNEAELDAIGGTLVALATGGN